MEAPQPERLRGVADTQPGSGPKPTLKIVDPNLEHADTLLELGKIALQDLASTVIVPKARLDAAKLLQDHEILLLQTLRSTIDLFELPKDFPELLVDRGEALVNSPLKVREPPIDLHEAPVDIGELPGQKFNELLILRRGHIASLPQGGGVFNPYPSRHRVLALRGDEGEDQAS
jgi:hypothetical protein